MVNPLLLILGIAIVAIGIGFIVFRHRIDRFNNRKAGNRSLDKLNEMLGGRPGELATAGSSLILGVGWVLLGLLSVLVSFYI